MSIDLEFRPLTQAEKGFLERLFEKDFPQRNELRRQMNLALARTIDRDGSLAFSVPSDSISAEGRLISGEEKPDELLAQALPVEGRYFDVDGVPVCVMLHVNRGQLHQLEILKVDGSRIVSDPWNAKLILGSPTAAAVVPPGTLWPPE